MVCLWPGLARFWMTFCKNSIIISRQINFLTNIGTNRVQVPLKCNTNIEFLASDVLSIEILCLGTLVKFVLFPTLSVDMMIDLCILIKSKILLIFSLFYNLSVLHPLHCQN